MGSCNQFRGLRSKLAVVDVRQLIEREFSDYLYTAERLFERGIFAYLVIRDIVIQGTLLVMCLLSAI